MFIVKIGEDTVKVVEKEDVKVLIAKLLDVGCDERVTTKFIADGDMEGVEDD
jgi:hypothetical protein